MKFFVIALLFVSSTSFAQGPQMKPQSFLDVVHKVKTTKDKSLITFKRTPTIYEVPADSQKEILKKLEASQKNQKAIEVTVEPVSRKIIEVKGP
ncbi:hypothetical protein QJS83_09880 [Bdellovibrio sp. 22V]|uniref:hypothetical protein n=1 Tax=Bdellovibrio TaxID=958 RepID=UPI00254311E9|nr:hypothetical protein [Bdellovibrio sp. 22V]WII70768.1 hypothetical protein QJS83_09880 [Bdellovibrio sp. 22V]